jgi:F0F1-type ATP synthase assembly protein I
MAIGFFVGRWLDRVLSTAPWLTVVFTAFGIAGGFLNAIRTALRIGREEDEAARKGERDG